MNRFLCCVAPGLCMTFARGRERRKRIYAALNEHQTKKLTEESLPVRMVSDATSWLGRKRADDDGWRSCNSPEDLLRAVPLELQRPRRARKPW